ncbi:MAG: hypothetical protein WD468_00505 [Pirellulales bacterium]
MWLRLVGIVGVIFVTLPAVAEQADKNEKTPDFCQTDQEGQFDNGGRKFCGPVATSNSIMWFAQNGYPQLIDGKLEEKETQIELIRTLASPEYMATNTTIGTSSRQLMKGIARYVNERGLQFAELEYRGWSPVGKQFNPTERRPTLQWVAQAVENPRGGACVNIGWYTYDKATDTYTRRSGHWMTATGLDLDQDKATMALHDPSSRSGQGNVTHYSHLERLTSGTLTGSEKGLPTSAAGLYLVPDGIIPKEVVKGEKTYPIIDGIVVMVLQ